MVYLGPLLQSLAKVETKGTVDYSHLKACQEKDLPLSSHNCCQGWVLCSVLDQEPKLITGLYQEAALLCGPLHCQLETWQLASPSRQVRGQKRSGNWKEVTDFHNLSRNESQHFCCILLIRSESLKEAHIQDKRIKGRCEYQEVEIIGNLSEAATLNKVSIQKIHRLFSLGSPFLLVLW